MILSRKGLSDIVTNVLIILLVLVAIGIIWAFVRPTINQGAGQLQGQSECLSVSVTPVSCTYTSGSDARKVTYERNAASGEVQAIKFIFKDASGNSKVVDVTGSTEIPAPLVRLSKDFTATDLGATYTSVDTAVVIRVSNDPAGRTCEVRNAPVNCVVAP